MSYNSLQIISKMFYCYFFYKKINLYNYKAAYIHCIIKLRNAREN